MSSADIHLVIQKRDPDIFPSKVTTIASGGYAIVTAEKDTELEY